MGLEPEAIGHQAMGIHRTGIGERRRCWGRPCTMNDLIGRYEEIVSCRASGFKALGSYLSMFSIEYCSNLVVALLDFCR